MRNIMRNILKTFVILFTAAVILTSCGGGGGGGSGAAPVATTSGVDYTYVGNFNVDNVNYSVLEMKPNQTFELRNSTASISGSYVMSRAAAHCYTMSIPNGVFSIEIDENSVVFINGTVAASGTIEYPLDPSHYECPHCGRYFGSPENLSSSVYHMYNSETDLHSYTFTCNDCGFILIVSLRADQVAY